MVFSDLCVCGAGGFHHQVEDDPLPNFPSKSRKIKKKRRIKNLYSKRGLDKFDAVLANLEEERKRIYGQMDANDILLVGFSYTDGNEWVPIVVKSRRAQEEKCNSKSKLNHVDAKEEHKSKTKLIDHEEENSTKPKRKFIEDEEENSTKPKRKFIEEVWPSFNDRIRKKRKSLLLSSGSTSNNWYVVVMLILFCLVIYGISFAIIAISVWWYLVPQIKGDGMDFRRSMKKKAYENKRSMQRSSLR